MEGQKNLVIFEGKQLRHVLHNGENYYSVVDVIEILTDSPNPRRYWADLKRRTEKEVGSEVFAFCEQLKMVASDGKNYQTIAANTEGVFRIIQSVPSPKAEPFKQWMAGLGKQALDEAIDPELGFDRLTELYQAKGYSEEWINNRIKTIETRKRLTDEWKNRGVTDSQDYSKLTATIAKGTFGLTPTEHKQLKGIEKDNLRDHMTPLELIFTALGEEVTRTLAVRDDAQGFQQNYESAMEGGQIAGEARERVEVRTGQKVVSATNFLEKIAEKDSLTAENEEK
jgi:DNA-damage-inducible protein D